jgi:ketosteroid isomerase-like protein
MSSMIDENKGLVRRFFDAIESGDFRVLDEIVAADYDDHLAGQTPGDGVSAVPNRERPACRALGSR